MTDLALLGIRVHADGVLETTGQMDRFAKSAGQAEQGANRLGDAARRASGSAGLMAAALRQQEAVMRTTRNAGLGFSRQFADIGVSAAMGMNPLMILIQQGPQIADIFQQAKIQGVGFNQMLGTMRAQIAPVLAILSPIAIGVGAVAAAFGLAARDMNKGNEDVVKSLGLTEKQLERLKKSGEDMGVTMGDVFRGVGTTIKDVLGEAFGPQLTQAKSAWSGFLDDLGHNTMNELRAIVGTFTGAYGAVTATWKMLPAAMGDAAYTSVRAIVGAMQFLIDKAVSGIQMLRDRYNSLPSWMRGGQAAPDVAGVRLALPDNPYAGAMSQMGAAGQEAYDRDYQRGVAWVNARQADVRANSEASRLARLQEAGGDRGADAAGRKARVPVERMFPTENINLTPLSAHVPPMITNLQLLAEELRQVNGLANETAENMARAFGAPGKALGDLLSTMTGVQARMATINEDLESNRLTAAQADRQRAQAQIQSYGDMAAAAKGFFKEGSDGYRVMAAAEQAFRLVQFAMSVRAMIQRAIETTAAVTGSGVEAAAVVGAETAKTGVTLAGTAIRIPLKVAEGAASMFAALGPFGFPAVAAMLAVMAMVGFSGGRGGGGQKGPSGSGTGFDAAGSAATAQGQMQTARAGQQAFAGTVAQSVVQTVKVEVGVNDERFNAYVADQARPMIASSEKRMTKALPAQVNRGIALGQIGEPAWA